MKLLIQCGIFFLFSTTLLFSQVPAITTLSTTSAAAGSTITINGTNFISNTASNMVYFCGVPAVVTAASSTSLTVTVPAGAAYGPVLVTSGGKTASSSSFFMVTYNGGMGIINSSFTRVDQGTFGAWFLASADFNNDGKPDVLVTDNNSNLVSILKNTSTPGSVSFATKTEAAVGSGPYNIATPDIDGDGKLDLVVANYAGTSVSVLKNTSSGGTISFAAKVDFTVPYPNYVAAGDLDGDGKPDIVTVYQNSTSLSILRNTSTSTVISFDPRVDLTTGNSPKTVVLGDMDGDGKLDIIVSHNGSNFISVFRNTSTPGALSFAARFDIPTAKPTSYLTLGDINNDGKQDIIATDLADANSTISIYPNSSSSGSLIFGVSATFSVGDSPREIALADYNGDGKLDIATANHFGGSISVLQNTTTPTGISFATRVDFPAVNNVLGLLAADIDGDGKPDIVTTRTTGNSISVFQNVMSSSASSPGLIAYYPFTGNANDISGNNNNGTVNGATLTNNNPGAANSAYSFNGTTDYITVPNSSTLQSPSHAFGLSAWVYVAAWNNGWAPVISKSKTSNYGQYTFQLNDNGGNLWFNTDQMTFTYDFNVKKWYHIAVSWDGDNVRFYVDGKLQGTQSYTKTLTSDTNPLEIGRDTPGSTEYLNGRLDNIRIFNRALGETEIATLFNENGTLPSTVTGNVTSIANTSGVLNSTINPNGATTTAYFEYSTTLDFSSFMITSITSVGSGTTASNFTATVSGLTPGSVYYYRIVAQNSAGYQKGVVRSFYTSNALTLNNSFSNTMPYPPVEQWYNITVPLDGLLKIENVSASNIDLSNSLYDSDGIVLITGEDSSTTTYSRVRIFVKAGTYFLKVTLWNGTSSGSYTVTTTFTSPSRATDAEPNDNIVSAVPMNVNTSTTGHIGYYGQGSRDVEDYYSFTVPSDGRVSVRIDHDSYNAIGEVFDLNVSLYDVNGKDVISASGSDDGKKMAETIHYLKPGTYYARVYLWYGSGGATYQLSVTHTPALLTNDLDGNDSVKAAQPLTFSNGKITQTGHLGYYSNGKRDLIDYFKFDVPSDGRVLARIDHDSVNADNQAFDMSLTIYDVNGKDGISWHSADDGKKYSQIINYLQPGTYFARVDVWSGSGGASYTLTMTHTPNAFANDGEGNDSVSAATSLSLNTPTTGHIGYMKNGQRDVLDFWSFTVPSDGKIIVRLDHDSLNSDNDAFDCNLDLYDSDGKTATGTYFLDDGKKYAEITHFVRPAKYYARVSIWSGIGGVGYTLKVTHVLPARSNDVEGNDSSAAATPIVISNNTAVITGHIGYMEKGTADVVDYWKLTNPSDAYVVMKLDHDTADAAGKYFDLNMDLYDTDGKSGLYAFWDDNGKRSYGYQYLKAGIFFLRVTRWNGTAGTYAITVNLTPAMGANDIEPNDYFRSAQTLPYNVKTTGHLGYNGNLSTDYNDYWKFTAPATDSVYVHVLSDSTLDVSLQAYGPDSTSYMSGEEGTAIYSRAKFKATAGVQYFAKVSLYRGYAGAYSIIANRSYNLTNVQSGQTNIPVLYSLDQNYPNPFNPSTTIHYGLPTRSRVRIQVFNILGQVVTELVNNEQATGYQSVVWNSNASSGMYFYRLEATSLDNPSKRFVETKKMLLLR